MTPSLLFPFIEGSTVIGGFEHLTSDILHLTSILSPLLFMLLRVLRSLKGLNLILLPSDISLQTSDNCH